jgi:hypothetical protein
MPGLDLDLGGKVGHPPSAHGLVMIDFDNTIVPWGTELMEDRLVKREDRDAINALKHENFRIGIFTSRVSPTWCKNAATHPSIQLAYVQMQLMRNAVLYDFVTAEKLPAEVYFDDKGWRVEDNLALQITLWRLNRDG